MKFIWRSILKSARRSKRRTVLTVAERRDRRVPVRRRCAPCSTASTPAPTASSSTRIVTHPLDVADLLDADEPRRGDSSTPGVRDVTWANWFGGIYKDPQNFFAQFAVEPESYLRHVSRRSC